MTRRRAWRTVVLVVLAASVGLLVGWLSSDRGWARLVGSIALLSALAVYVVLDSRRDRR